MLGERVIVSHVAPSLILDQGGSVEKVRVTVRNLDAANPVDLGGPAVAAGTGYPLLHNEVQQFVLGPGDKLYGIATTADVSVGVLRTITED